MRVLLQPRFPSGRRRQEDEQRDVFSALETKVAYYKKSGGGITMSGGECMLQYRFVVALAKEAHKRGLTAIIDTAAHGNEQIWDFVLPNIDMAPGVARAPTREIWKDNRSSGKFWRHARVFDETRATQSAHVVEICFDV